MLQKYIYPAPGSHGQTYQKHNLITVYCPVNFEIFQVRVNNMMSLYDLKVRIAQRFNTTASNINISIGDKEYKGQIDESKMMLVTNLGVNQYSVVRITYKNPPEKKKDKPQGIKARHNFTSSIAVTTNNNNCIERPLNKDAIEQHQQDTDILQDTCLLQQFNSYQDKMNDEHPQCKESAGISYRKIHQVKSKKFQHNIKLMQSLKEPQLKNSFMSKQDQWKATLDKINNSSSFVEQNTKPEFSSFLSNNQSTDQKNKVCTTTVVMSNKTLDNSLIRSTESKNIKVKSSSVQYCNASFQGKSFIEEINHPAVKVYQETKQQMKKTFDPQILEKIVSKPSQVKYKMRKRSELNDDTKRKMHGQTVDKMMSRILNQ